MSGWLDAADVESCRKKLEKMGMKPRSIHQPSGVGAMEVAWEAPKDAETEEPAPPTSQPSIVPPHIEAQAAAMTKGPVTMAPRLGDIPIAAPITTRDLESARPIRRRQSLYMGEAKEIKGLVDDALDRRGVVVQMAVNPDIRGHLILAIVIEHDDYKETK